MDLETKEELCLTNSSSRRRLSAPPPTGSVSTSDSYGRSSRTNDTTHTGTTSEGQPGCINGALPAAGRDSPAATERSKSLSAERLKDFSAVARSESRIGPVQQEFESDPSHEFWTWSQDTQNWYHVQGTGSVLWAPHQLD
ncbi:hypothetical protein CMEL01_13421 [Colletotrichum melonis]|uniref:Uncharacterized protein n=1 Tax=Colletotrichum melonis TaxID=1209925 RepID=A0AAI9UTY7_9PEZI|nr:hypothetical protein CMEL01_13421 [Colletotrichum melonis]